MKGGSTFSENEYVQIARPQPYVTSRLGATTCVFIFQVDIGTLAINFVFVGVERDSLRLPSQVWLRNEVVHHHLFEHGIGIVLQSDQNIGITSWMSASRTLSFSCSGLLSNCILASSHWSPVSFAHFLAHRTDLEHYNEASIPHIIPFHAPQRWWRVERSASLRCLEYEVRVLSIQIQESSCPL